MTLPTPPAVRRATRADSRRVADIFASAFADDPVFAWMLPADRGEHRRRLVLGAMSGQALRHGEVWISDEGQGAAAWLAPDQWRAKPLDLLRTLPAVARGGGRRLPTMLRALTLAERHHPKDPPHWYLEILGTASGRQSRGTGSALMAVMLERCDREGVPAYLESSNPRNIPFYARHGFVVTETISLGPGAPSVAAMWREPRTPG